MKTQLQSDRPGISRPKRRGVLLWLGRIVAVLLGLVVIGAVWESVSEVADEKAYPPPGQLVDVGGYRLHINCTGAGSPVVVIDAGLGGWSTEWGTVQSGVARTTRVCTYDRAGSGWSEEGPLPRNARKFAEELHTLLQRAGIPAPYVLVGHSAGGLTVRVFAHDYPSEVAGIVLVDSMSPRQFSLPPAGTGSEASSRSHALPFVSALARLGVMRLAARLPGIAIEGAYAARFARPQYWQAYMDESQGMVQSAAQAAEVKSFGDLPLIVLSRGLDPDADWQANQEGLVQMSSNSEQVFADKSGHNIEIDQPEAAVTAIARVVERLRQR